MVFSMILDYCLKSVKTFKKWGHLVYKLAISLRGIHASLFILAV
jgi:hypothetical protein